MKQAVGKRFPIKTFLLNPDNMCNYDKGGKRVSIDSVPDHVKISCDTVFFYNPDSSRVYLYWHSKNAILAVLLGFGFTAPDDTTKPTDPKKPLYEIDEDEVVV
jgi:hypothetical protein